MIQEIPVYSIVRFTNQARSEAAVFCYTKNITGFVVGLLYNSYIIQVGFGSVLYALVDELAVIVTPDEYEPFDDKTESFT